MAKDIRQKDIIWEITDNPDGTTLIDKAKLAVLMDLRDELKKLNRVFECRNFLGIPHILSDIRAMMTSKGSLEDIANACMYALEGQLTGAVNGD